MDSALDRVARIVFPMGLSGADVEVDEVARAPRSDREGEAREKRAGRGLVFESGRGVVVAREGHHLVCDGARGRLATKSAPSTACRASRDLMSRMVSGRVKGWSVLWMVVAGLCLDAVPHCVVPYRTVSCRIVPDFRTPPGHDRVGAPFGGELLLLSVVTKRAIQFLARC